MSKIRVKKIVKAYAQRLKSERFSFSAVYLYGSYAKKNSRKWSDIDVCVVSNKFADEKKWDQYERQLWYWRRDIDPRIEPIGLSPREFAGLSPLADEIKTTGVRIA